ncbi:MAG: hypothetical protein NVS1B11_27230 [Terriglobales bacterium]
MELAPSFKLLNTTPATYIWAIAADREGSIYGASGAPARIYRIAPDGHASAIFQPHELQVQTLVVEKNGVIYAATNPDGKVYRIEREAAPNKGEAATTAEAISGWNASVYFDPHTKYIWDLALDSAGNLYVATGDQGEIFRVTSKGEHSLFFKSDEPQIRVLDFDSKGNLIAGSDASGLIYRISPKGEGFVLYSAPKKEITALAIDKEGNIYAAGVGDKRSSSPSNLPALPLSAPPPAASNVQPQTGISIGNSAASPSPAISNLSGSGVSNAGGSEIYKIAPDGSPTRLWGSPDIVYALTFDQQGHLLAGTGNRGRIFSITGEDNFTDLLKASATQVTAFARAPNGGLFVATSNLGKILSLGDTPSADGVYESDVFDAHIFSKWGRAEVRAAGNVELFTRSGNVDNPDRNWSPWKKIDLRKDAAINSPAARFIQWKAVLHSGNPSPRLNSVRLNYLPKNVAPDIEDVTVQAGIRYQPSSKSTTGDIGGSGTQSQHSDSPPPGIHDRDSIGVRWNAHDDNDDQMVYSLYYRGDGENRWLLLKDNLTDNFYSFESVLLPDGGYTIKVRASDAPSHPPEEALTAEKESSRFEVDTAPPRIEDLKGQLEGSKVHIAFRAVDSFSAIKRAEFSVDAGTWQFLEPVGQLSDSKTENYDFRIPLPREDVGSSGQRTGAEDSEHVIVVRVYDRYDNMNSAKTIVRTK